MTIDLNLQKGLMVLQISELITPPSESRSQMKHLLLTTIAAVVLVGCVGAAIGSFTRNTIR